MRVRSVNEKAVAKLIGFLKEIYKTIESGSNKDFYLIQSEHHISKSTISVCKKLGVLSDHGQWDLSYKPDRLTAIKILEFLRQQSDKQTDKPINDMWCQEVSQIKLLLSEIRDKLSEKNNRSEGLKIAHSADQSKNDRLETSRLIVASFCSGRATGNIDQISIDCIVETSLWLTDALLTKLNS